MTAVAPAGLADGLAALLRGERIAWSSLGATREQFLEACREEDLCGLLHQALGRWSEPRGWPDDVREDIAREARAAVATELLRRRELTAVLEALGTRGIRPILLKGTPLAYTVYQSPSHRPRNDTDLLIPRDAVEATKQVMNELGYTAPNYCDGELVFRQFELGKEDTLGVRHALDFHWQVSMQTVFADFLTYDELAADAEAVPALGTRARAPGRLHALLLACVHPAMHHRNVERLIWVHDVHLLAEHLSRLELDQFVELAARKAVGAICAQELTRARARFGTDVPETIVVRLASSKNEPSAVYLEPDRRWQDELVSNVRGLSRWWDRLRLLREVAFPSPAYLLRAYGLTGGSLGAALLPALYVHRGVKGVWKVIRGRK